MKILSYIILRERAYRAASASLDKLVDFLNGKYASVVRVPIWCIGIE